MRTSGARYESAGQGNVAKCSRECFQAEDKLVFAKDYNYVGGFYGVRNAYTQGGSQRLAGRFLCPGSS